MVPVAFGQVVIPGDTGGEEDKPKEKKKKKKKKECTEQESYLTLMTEGRMSAKYKDFPAAIVKFETAQGVCPLDPMVTYELARAQQLGGKCEVAKALYKQSLSQLSADVSKTELTEETVEAAMTDNDANCGSATLVAECPADSTWSEAEQKCILNAPVEANCPAGSTWSESDAKCIADGTPDCPAGSKWSAAEGKCMADGPVNAVAGQTGGTGGNGTGGNVSKGTEVPGDPGVGLNISVGVSGKGGIGAFDDSDAEVGVGGGAQVFGLLKLAEGAFAVGLDFDFLYTTHSGSGGSTDIIAPSLGVKIRLDLGSDLVFGLFANYVFGTGTVSVDESLGLGNFESDFSLSGVAIGGDINWIFKLGEFKTWLEAGLYVHYNYLEDDVDESINYINAGVTLGVSFDIGI